MSKLNGVIKRSQWVCLNDNEHVFEECTEDGWCPDCPPITGVLVKVEAKPDPLEDITVMHPTGGRDSETPVSHPPAPEVGLCVLMMDASVSMTEPAFAGSKLTRMQLVASSAAGGIFDLERMQNNPNAFVAAFKFDDRVEFMFADSVANLINRFAGDVRRFSDYIHEELFKMQQGTDINKALQHAYDYVAKFLNKELSHFPVRHYTPMKQRIFKLNSNQSVAVPNIRVLIYTDGMQYDAHGERLLYPNPFKANPMSELKHDVVIGAYFGQRTDEGCRELEGLLSRCPLHDERQFFVFDNPAQISNLKYLFRMASGASGFCPKCLEKQLNR